MTIAQGINKTVAYKKQSGLGSAASGSGGTLLRRVTAALNQTKDSYENNEIVSHQQGTGMTHGIAKTGGTLNGLMSGTTWMPFLGSLLRKDPAATAAISSLSLTIATSGSNYTITRVPVRGSPAASRSATLPKSPRIGGRQQPQQERGRGRDRQRHSDHRNVLNTGSTLTAEGPIASCTVTVMGKKSWAPTSGHTNDYYTFEEWYNDLSKSRVFPTCRSGRATSKSRPPAT
jgi:hypothetical protein